MDLPRHLKLHKTKNKLYHECLRTKSVEDFTNYKKLRNRLTHKKKQPKELTFKISFETRLVLSDT